ncbi:MAG: PrsW family intramembrane metalloprotease [Dehalococcoidia bacterium]|nr:PrsW family intramembrane metalloprotease [Dehalococcoidia bacterium]
MAGLAAVAGALAFLGGAASALALVGIEESDPQTRLWRINVFAGSAVVYLLLGGFLVVQATSALGGASSSPWRLPRPWLALPLFPALVAAGQWLALHPERLSWLFPLVNVGMVCIPSLAIAAFVARRYVARHPLAWPISWREWTTGLIYGAIGATTIAGVINTAYLVGVGAWLVSVKGHGFVFPLDDGLRTLPAGWGVFLDLTTLSVVAPLNEELWKALLVALFFFRRGGAARCFVWGVLAGTGFNLLETFQNSLSAVSPDALAEQTIGNSWWLFATARAGTAAMHGLASGLSALGLYGLLRRRPTFLLGYPAGVLLHGTWNLLVYAVVGDALLSGRGPDSRLLDVVGLGGLLLVFAASCGMLWLLSGRLRDEGPAPIYRLLGMRPAVVRSPAEAHALAGRVSPGGREAG